MSSSPFELFRRNLKPMMVFLTLLALVSFVILPSVAMYQQQNMGGGGTSTTLATFNGGEYDFGKVNYFTRNHFATTQFLGELAELTIARGGVPKVADFQYDTQRKAIQSLGINSNPSDRASVRTLMYAAEAKKTGLELDDEAIRTWLTLYTDGRLSQPEINGVLAKSTRNQIGQVQLYDQLRTQLLAQAYQRQVMAGLTSGGMPIVPPAQQWELFLRLNRRATADAYAVNVADFIDKTNAKPSEKEIKEVYEASKSIYPDDQSPKPGFYRPYTTNVEYLAGNLGEFIDREIAALTEEQLRAEYQKRLDGGEFKLPDMPAEPPADPLSEAPAGDMPASDMPASDMPASEPAKTEAPAPTEPAPATGDAASPAAPETPAADAPEMKTATEPAADADAQPAVENPVEKPAEKPADQPAAEAAKAVEEVTEPAKSDSSRNPSTDNGIRLVAMQAETPAAPTDEPAAPAEPADAKPADAKPADTEPAVTETTEAKPKADEPKDAKPETDSKPAADQPAEEKPAEEKPAEEKPAMTEEPAAKATEDAKPAEDSKPAEDTKPEAPKVETFEDVRDDIARSLAMQPALEKLDAAVSEVDKTMRTYFNARAIAGNKADQVPAPPDLKALAEKLGMKHVVTGMQNVQEIQNDPVALSFGVGVGMQRGEGFLQTMYATRPATPLYTPVRTVDDQSQVSYIAWKTEEKAAYVPEWKEVREEVITAIRTAEARKLAKAEAERLSKEFTTSDKPAKELVPEDRKSLYFESLGPFSWMNSMGFGMRAFMGNVPELDRVGEAFMRQVFTSDRDKWGVAPNMPETVYYVVKPTEFSPSTDELHQRFVQASQRMQTMSLAVEEAIKIRDGHYETLDRRTGFEWNEDALVDE